MKLKQLTKWKRLQFLMCVVWIDVRWMQLMIELIVRSVVRSLQLCCWLYQQIVE